MSNTVATATSTPSFQDIAITQLAESKLNPRKTFDPVKLSELAESLKNQGCLNPLLVRPVWPDGTAKSFCGNFEIAGGHRRKRAAEIAGLTTLPCVVRNLTDQQFIEAVVVDNLQRDDVHPAEEADGYQQLIDTYGYTPAMLAERVGRSDSYIGKRLALGKLAKPVREAFLENKIELGHALLICGLTPKDQERVLGGMFEQVSEWDEEARKPVPVGTKVASVSGLKIWIESNILLGLSRAPWDKADEKLVKKAGACTVCPKRTGANLVLFDDSKPGDHCLDGSCWKAKTDAHVAAAIKAAEKAGTPLVKVADTWTHTEGVLRDNEYRVVDGKKVKACDNTQRAIVVESRGQVGRMFDICCDHDCKIHFERLSHGAVAKKDKPFAEVWATRRTNLNDRIRAAQKNAVFAAFDHAAPKKLDEAAMRLILKRLCNDANHDGCHAMNRALGIEDGNQGCQDKLLEYAAEMNLSELNAFAYLVAATNMALTSFCRPDDMYKAAKGCGVDVEGITKKVEADLVADFDEKFAKAKAAHDAKQKKAAKAEAADAEPEKPKVKKKSAKGKAAKKATKKAK